MSADSNPALSDAQIERAASELRSQERYNPAWVVPGEQAGAAQHDEPDTGEPPCDFCRREIPCECDATTCMCTCGRCLAEPLPPYQGPVRR